MFTPLKQRKYDTLHVKQEIHKLTKYSTNCPVDAPYFSAAWEGWGPLPEDNFKCHDQILNLNEMR